MMDSLYDGRILLLLFIGSVFHLILYFTKTNRVISAKAFRKLLLFCWGTIFIFTIAVLGVRHPFKDRSRVACFPVASSEKWLGMVVADGINDVLKSVNPSTLMAYPTDWMYDAIETDSTSDIHYLQSYSKRIDLDFLVILQVRSRLEHGYMVEWSFYDLNENKCLRTDTDSIKLRQPDDFFRHITQDVLAFASVGRHSVLPPDLPATTAWEPFGRGRYHQLNGDITKAEDDYRTALAIDSNDGILKKALSSVLVEKAVRLQVHKKFSEDVFIEAADLLRQTLTVDSNDAEANRLLGDIYIQSEQWNKAENVLQKAFLLEKDDPLIYWSMSRIHPSRYKYSGFKSKTQLLQRALQMNPAFERARLALGDDFYYRNKPGEAEAIYKELLRIHPRSLDGLLALGKLYVSRNDILHIIRVYERVLEISPEYADAYYNLGIAYYNDDKVDVASGFFKKAIDIDNHADSYLYLGIIHARKGESEQAIEYFRHRIRLRTGVNDPYAEEARRQLNYLIQDGERIP